MDARRRLPTRDPLPERAVTTWTEYGVLLADGSPSTAASADVARAQADALNDLSTALEAVHQPVQRTVRSTPVDKTRAAVSYGKWSRLRRAQPVDGSVDDSANPVDDGGER